MDVKRTLVSLSLAGLGVLGCGAPSSTELRVRTASELAVRSAPDLASNQAGLVAPSRVQAWLSNWRASRPAGVEGDLVVMQLGGAPGTLPFIASREGVRAYHAEDLGRFLEPRNNGLLAVGTVPTNGLLVDRLLRKYDIEPNRDFVLLALGEPSARGLEELARVWLSFRYWGFEHASLGVLHGSVAEGVPESLRQATAVEPPFEGGSRVAALRVDHTAVLAHLGEVRAAIGRSPIADTRSKAEYEGSALGTSAFDDTCLKGAGACTPTFSGRIASARHLPSSALRSPDGATLRSLPELDQALAEAGLDRSAEVIVYDADGRTSAVAAFALLAVAGVPARWYAPSFAEWGALNASHPDPALRLLPESSAWRTDVFPSVTEGQTAWADPQAGVRPLLFAADVSAPDRVQQQDREYKQAPPVLPPVDRASPDCR